MKPIEGYDAIEEAGTLKRLPAGPQICKIIEAVENQDKEYLEIYFDISEGEFKGYFALLQANTGKNYGIIRRSYKKNALPFFKAAMTAIEKSNVGYKWDWNEKGLSDKACVIVFREEEYMMDGEVRTRVVADEIRSVQALRNGEIRVKPIKRLEVAAAPAGLGYPAIDEEKDDLPF